ncbi:hypothetical protein OF83DRAFT_457658 [Amylostereum chailletii]|nr:hypothetical protein OF83DRAFT_457658 [Amylostereum chailletii]
MPAASYSVRTRRVARASPTAPVFTASSNAIESDDDTILMKYEGELPFIVKRKDAYEDVIASARSNIRAPEVQQARNDDIQITAFHPKYPNELTQVTKEVWASVQPRLTEFTVAIRALHIRLLVLSCSSKTMLKSLPSGPATRREEEEEVVVELSDSDDSDDKEDEEDSEDFEIVAASGSAPPDTASRKRNRIRTYSGRIAAKVSQPPKKRVHWERHGGSKGAASSKSKNTDYMGYPSFAAHQALEAKWTKKSQWLVPTTDRIVAARAYVYSDGDDAEKLSRTEINWINRRVRHFMKYGKSKKGSMPTPGRELYESMMAAHEGHASGNRTWKNLRKKCLWPTRAFSYAWQEMCPTCWDQPVNAVAGGSREVS